VDLFRDLFRRRGRPRRAQQAQAAAIAAFWTWWTADGAKQTTEAIVAGHPERVEPEISRRIDAIATDLVWELAPGERSRHELVVSAEGDPTRRAVVRRWRMAAPPADLVWEYSDARRPAGNPSGVVLHIDEAELDVARASAHARVRGAAVDVTVYHPQFSGLPEQTRALATFLLLNTVLGETTVETWLGAIGSTDLPPLDPVPLAGLRSVIAELHKQFTDADGGPSWTRVEGTTPSGDPVIAAAQVPLRAVTAPQLDTYVGVAVPFLDRTPAGMPGVLATKALDDLEEQLTERLGGNGRLVAHETARGVRVLHFYVDSTTAAAEQLEAAVNGWEEGRVGLDVRPDPAWEAVQHLAG
jgi:hypothetical protein